MPLATVKNIERYGSYKSDRLADESVNLTASVMKLLIVIFFALVTCAPAFANAVENTSLSLTEHWIGYAALIIFVVAYIFVVFEEQLHLRKSKPMLLAAGLMWLLIAVVYQQAGNHHAASEAIRHNFLAYAELFFFLLVAMTYINSMLERRVFDALRDKLIIKGFSYRQVFWLTGALTFLISPIADNLTTALIMSSVVLAVASGQATFIALGCVNIVIAANAGGVFSPFGDITTLMVWQTGHVEFGEFLTLLLPALVNYLVPALIMQFALPKGKPLAVTTKAVPIKKGGLVIVSLFLCTILTAVSFHHYLNLPPVFGMMTGLAYLKLYAYYLHKFDHTHIDKSDLPTSHDVEDDFDIFDKIANAQWDTLFFFYGVILAVGGLGFIGYLTLTSNVIYGELGATTANILVGLLSAIVDNIPVMFAVLSMQPEMNQLQWLLVTLTAGVGGSLLSIGSAAGVALMGQARGQYTFFSHLKWTPVIALGYFASIVVHFLLNG
jgi:NhaD family Na+/H+ antiporter